MRLKRLDQQVMVITGASSGIGLETARRAARAGAKVLLVARNEPVLAQICRDLTAEGLVADYAVADVGAEAQVQAAAAKALELYGRIDTWANVAGVAVYARLEELPRDEHERMFLTNYWGVVNGALAALAPLKRQGGALITVGSIVSDFGAPIMGGYSASKHAAKGFIDSLRIELIAERAPVSVTLIKPSGVGSPLPEHAANHLPRAARVPPPAYAPSLVARAILHAAQHRRREMTVGGAGRVVTLAATHFPNLSDRVSTAIIPLLSTLRWPRTPEANLFGPLGRGRVRSAHQPGRSVSAYALLDERPVTTGAVIGLGLLAALALLRRRR